MRKIRIGIIDIGTNTFNLLIVDKTDSSFEKVFGTKVGVGLGLGGINEGFIAKEAMTRGLETLKMFLTKCKEFNVSHVKGYGTSVIRDASNKDDFLDIVENDLKLNVEVISGAREAELIYQGVKIGHPFKSPTLIMDIGGGSTEFIYANKQKVLKSESFDIGTARIYELFDFQDPYTEDNEIQVIEYLELNTKGFFDDIETNLLIGASGSFETFYAVMKNKEYPDKVYQDMGAHDVRKVLDEMIQSTLQEREANPFIIPIRKKMAPIAAIKIKWIFDKLNIKTLTISPFAMKEGVILEFKC